MKLSPPTPHTPFVFYNHLPKGYDLFTREPLSIEVWDTKYRFKDEATFQHTAQRVCDGVYANDTQEHRQEGVMAMSYGLWMPGGRIIAGAGTDKHVTLMNCYVNGTIEDSMEGIWRGYGNVMFTMQQGGGIGTDFSPIRPDGAWLSRTQAKASGPIPFAKAQDGIGICVESAGERRGAQMGTLSDTHPDLPKFITVKQTPGTLTQFNLSILVSDAFMAAVHEDEDWLLYHEVAPLGRDASLVDQDFFDEETGKQQYVYAVWKARDLWKLITENTYEYSEPGVIFIDRVNDLNNLQYCETIRCTNPCGEQPLPPHGTCNLGAVNLALMVRNPFTDDAEFDWDLLRNTVRVGVRFLDNVIDVTNYPLPEQEAEEKAKRRIGLGFSGLASAMAQLGLRYGSNKSADFAGEVTKAIAYAAYGASAALAEERGAFPLYDMNGFWTANSFAGKKFNLNAQDIPEWYLKPMRNGVLMTIAPTGTTSIAYGNIESGLEPAFLYSYTRNLTQRDGTKKPVECSAFTAHLWRFLFKDEPFPRHFITADQLKVYEHIAVQEACQEWVDASISKTINIPTEMPYEEFVTVYDLAYEAGLKGCTTYRPSDVRGSILQASTDTKAVTASPTAVLSSRPEELHSRTRKLKWPGLGAAAYINLGRLEDGQPFEIFLNSKDQRFNEWWATSTLLASWLLRMGVPLTMIAEELKKISSIEGYLVNGRYHQSFVSLVGSQILDMDRKYWEERGAPDSIQPPLPQGSTKTGVGRCRQCNSPRVEWREGCLSCPDCGESKCG